MLQNETTPPQEALPVTEPDPAVPRLRTWSVVVASASWLYCLVVSGYLLYVSLSGGNIAGCSEVGGCNPVIASRWGNVLGVPISALAILVYLCLLVSVWTVGLGRVGAAPVRRGLVWLMWMCMGAVPAAGVWLIYVQAVKLGQYCIWCNSSHLAGLIGVVALALGSGAWRRAAWERGDFTAQVTPLLLMLLGAIGAVSSGFLGVAKSAESHTLPTQVEARYDIDTGPGPDRRISILEGRVQLNPHQFPIYGSADAKVILVEFFDYTCPHCRTLAPMLTRARERYEGQLAVIPLFTALGKPCNDRARDNPVHADSCELGRLSLAVGRIDHDAWRKLDHYLMEGPTAPSVGDAYKYASGLVPRPRLDAELASDAVSQMVQSNLSLYRMIRERMGRPVSLPILIHRSQLIIGYPGDEESLFDLLEKSYGLTAPIKEPAPAQ